MNLVDIVTKDGQFDARKARQMMFEASRDSAIVGYANRYANHMGLSGEERYLFMAVALLSENIGVHAALTRTASPESLYARVAKDGPFETGKELK